MRSQRRSGNGSPGESSLSGEPRPEGCEKLSGLHEMVRVKYTDVDLVPQLPKLWWFKYGAPAKKMMDGFLDFLFAPTVTRRALGSLKMIVNLRRKL